jgi:hypothetical protein
MFMGGAIWGTETMRDEMRKIFAEMPTSKNP